MISTQDWFVVVNPASGAGRAGRRWHSLARALAAAGVGFEAVLTRHPGHATELAREAVVAGYRRVLAVGGDGVLHEALNGVMTQALTPATGICVGAAPLGSGNDWARAHGIPRDASGAARCVAAARMSLEDIGRLDFDAGGTVRSCYFINVAGAGLDADVLERLPRRVPRRLAYLLGLLRSLASFSPPRFELVVDGRPASSRALLTLLSLGPYCGGGMHLAPGAQPDDGLFDVLTVDPLRLPGQLPRLRRVFDGRLPGEPFAHYVRAARVGVAADPPVRVQADGQLVGRTPFVATVLPRAVLALRA
jgi:YegS/Rv2252/BmrU family lipid kinase